MSDYIKREDAIDAVGRVDRSHIELKGVPMLGACTLLDEIINIPSADVVEVVRCKDCKYKTADGAGALYCKIWDKWEMPINGFCCYGERGEGE